MVILNALVWEDLKSRHNIQLSKSYCSYCNEESVHWTYQKNQEADCFICFYRQITKEKFGKHFGKELLAKIIEFSGMSAIEMLEHF